MSVNRLEITLPMLCATPDIWLTQDALRDCPVTALVDLGRGWTAQAALTQAQMVIGHRRSQAAAVPVLLLVGLPIDDDAIVRLASLRPDGFVLSGLGGADDIQRLDVILRVAEAELGLDAGSIAIVAEAGGNAAFFLSGTSLRSVSQRLAAIVFDGDGYIKTTASRVVNSAASRAGAPTLFARAKIVLKATDAGIPCYDLLADDEMTDAGTARDIALADGFSGVIARNAQQLGALTAV